jgi:hypothetical protein
MLEITEKKKKGRTWFPSHSCMRCISFPKGKRIRFRSFLKESEQKLFGMSIYDSWAAC